MSNISKLIFLSYVIFLQTILVNSVEIYVILPPSRLKCLKERINKDNLVVGKFKTDNETLLVSIFIYDIDINEKSFNYQPKSPIYESIDVNEAKTAFTTFYTSSYSFCAYNKSNASVSVYFEIKHGTEARDYTQLAKKVHLNEATVFLKQIIDHINSFHANLKRIRKLEEKEKSSSDKLNDALILFSIVNMIIIIIAAIIQDFYFKKFFTSKKII